MSLAAALSDNPREHIGANNPPLTTADEMLAAHAAVLSGVDTFEAKVAKLPKVVKDDADDARLAEVAVAAGDLRRKIKDICTEEGNPHFRKHREINSFFKTFVERMEAIDAELTARATAYKREKIAAARREAEVAALKAQEEADRQRALADKAQGEGKAGKALLHDDRAEAAADSAFRLGVAAQTSSADLSRVRSATGAMSTTKGNWTFAVEDMAKIPLEELRPYLTLEVIVKALRAHVKTFKGSKPIAGVRFYLDEKASFRR